MSNVALFAWGVVVTLLAFAGTALLVVGAVLDGRDERATRLRLVQAGGDAAGSVPIVHDALPPAA